MLTETILRPRNLNLLLSCNLSTFAGLMGELVNRGSQSLTAVLLSVSVRQLNELDVLQLSDDQNDDENEGIPHCGQIQQQLVFLSTPYMLDDKPLQVLCTHVSQLSQQTAGSVCLTASLHSLHGNLLRLGPGFDSISPANARRNMMENRLRSLNGQCKPCKVDLQLEPTRRLTAANKEPGLGQTVPHSSIESANKQAQI